MVFPLPSFRKPVPEPFSRQVRLASSIRTRSWKAGKETGKTLEDIQALDAEHKKRKQDKKQSKPAAPASGNRFNNFQQREYNFDEYEKRLLNQ